MPSKIETYEGKSVISLWTDERYKFTFGLQKAKLLLEYLDAVRDFVRAQDSLYDVPSSSKQDEEEIILKKVDGKWTISPSHLENDKAADRKPF